MQKIVSKSGIPDILNILTERLTGSELNSLLLETFDRRVRRISPALLLNQYRQNRLVQPAGSDMISLMEKELQTLKIFRDHHFNPIELSPVAQLGSCSVVATADQKKILSACRNTEILADATNAIALHIADLKKKQEPESIVAGDIIRFCSTDRHLRTPKPEGRGMSAHFRIGCLVSAGRDAGNFSFEMKSMEEQLLALHALARNIFDVQHIHFKLQKRNGYANGNDLMEKLNAHLTNRIPGTAIRIDESVKENNYYKGVQFKMVIEVNGQLLEIADGGFVDWTQQLLGNKKERMLISGFGLELLQKFQSGIT